MITLNYINEVNNDSLQIGDIAYFITPSPLGGFDQSTAVPIFLGPVMAFTETTITVDDIIPGAQGTIQAGDFLMFGKDTSANVSGLVGYFAQVKINNNSKEKAEIYCISSEITPSSK